MSPQRLINPDLYYDHFIQHWHRATFGPDAWAIDLDLLGACKWCAAPLYLIEATSNPDKSTRILTTLGLAAHVPAILVRHSDDRIVRASWRNGKPAQIGGEEELKDALTSLRERHRELCRARGVA